MARLRDSRGDLCSDIEDVPERGLRMSARRKSGTSDLLDDRSVAPGELAQVLERALGLRALSACEHRVDDLRVFDEHPVERARPSRVDEARARRVEEREELIAREAAREAPEELPVQVAQHDRDDRHAPQNEECTLFPAAHRLALAGTCARRTVRSPDRALAGTCPRRNVNGDLTARAPSPPREQARARRDAQLTRGVRVLPPCYASRRTSAGS